MIRSISINTKAGNLLVASECNEDLKWRATHPTIREKSQVEVVLELNHQSEDISARAEMKLTPTQARQFARSLDSAASEAERKNEQ